MKTLIYGHGGEGKTSFVNKIKNDDSMIVEEIDTHGSLLHILDDYEDSEYTSLYVITNRLPIDFEIALGFFDYFMEMKSINRINK